jgi:NADPH:quinone reductase-like Zn-dependent oxidoreductase
VTVTPVAASYTPAKLAALLDMVADGRLVVPVAATVPLDDAAQALAKFAAGKLGKVVITTS